MTNFNAITGVQAQGSYNPYLNLNRALIKQIIQNRTMGNRKQPDNEQIHKNSFQ